MARQVSLTMDVESLRYPSWCLCRILEREVGTKEEVTLRRKCDAMRFFMLDTDMSNKTFYSGSRGEGFNFDSSDADWMYINKFTTVLESVHSRNPDDDRKTVLLMSREGCNPGFVTLQLLNRTNDRHIRESIVDYDGHPVVCSLLYRDVHRLPQFGQIGHGPCNTVFQGRDVDIAHCFKCQVWPKEANEFIYRPRHHGWPKKSLLDKIICRGCHLVPVGDKTHNLSHIQWRLSFSAAEKDLVHSFNHTQFLVYGLMKIFLKHVINRFQSVQGVLCSYFLKTAMFFSIESTPSSFWRDDLLIQCFWICFNKLIQWVEQGYCPNYFVIQNNMFRSKVFGENQQNLLILLKQCKRTGWKCIYLCKDFQPLENLANQSASFFSKGLAASERDTECSLDLISSSLLSKYVYVCQENMQKVLNRLLTLLIHSRTQQEKEFSTLLLYNVLRCIGESNFCSDLRTNNKGKYNIIRRCQRFISISSQNIGHEGMISLATFYHLIGQYKKAIQLLERAISVWKPYTVYCSSEHGKAYNRKMYHQCVCGRGTYAIEKLRSCFIQDVRIDLHNHLFYPTALWHDLEATAPFFLHSAPLPYAVFLLFLCHQNVGDINSCIATFHDLECLSRDEVQGLRQYPIVLNMMAICLEKLGDITGAVELCLLSQEQKSDRNGAEKLLDRMLSSLN